MDDKAQAQREMTVGEQIQNEIRSTDGVIKHLENLEPRTKPPVVQELVLARRHAEDASNRLKRAYNLLNDEDK